MASKRERTRARIADIAIALFQERGFEAVAVADIVRVAEVSEMTFYRHFPSKDAVVLDDPYDPLIATAIAGQPSENAPLARVAGGIRAAWQQIPEPESERTRERTRIIAASNQLRAGMWRNNAATERTIVEQLVSDGTDPLIARVAASACLAALMTAILDWAESDSGSLGDRVLVALDVLAGTS